jgi:sec-independent protein translocase protein TatC
MSEPLTTDRIDAPMSLGDHLVELRRRLMWPVISVVAVFIVSFGYHGQLKQWMVWPLSKAIAIVGAEEAAKVGLASDSTRLLTVTDLAESTMTAATISLYAAIAATIPVILWHLWQFIAVGLRPSERRLAFLFVPAGVICFYAGMALGYAFGLPYFYAWLINFAVNDPTIRTFTLTQTAYVDSFFNWTIAFGLIMDIPWVVVVICRTGLVRAATIAKARRYIVLANVLLAAVITPGSDAASLLALFLPMQALFELGLLIGRLIEPRRVPASPEAVP